MVFPVNDRKPNLDYPVIQPDCYDDARMDCFIEYDLTEFWPVEFEINLVMNSEPLPGINHELLEPDENGNLPPNKLITVELEIDLTAKGAKDEAVALMQLKSVIDEIFVVDEEDVTYSITDLDDDDEDVDFGDHDEF